MNHPMKQARALATVSLLALLASMATSQTIREPAFRPMINEHAALDSKPNLIAQAGDSWISFTGGSGAGKGKHIVLIAGDEEYRSEEGMPMLAKILAAHHGFKCTVIFPIDPKDGTINPNVRDSCRGLEALKSADLMIIFLRWRDLPDEQMKHIVDYVESGKPIIGLRTSTHAFRIPAGKTYSRWSYDSAQRPGDKDWDGGFGRQVLGETWISHHGNHGKQSTRGIVSAEAKEHPILRGLKDGDIWGPTDVYGVRLPLPGDSKPLVFGQVLEGMNATDNPVAGKQNEPMMPVAWTKTYTTPQSKTARVFATTMGASQDLASEGLRRLLVNATYWALGMETKITAKSNVDYVGDYKPTPFRGNGFAPGLKPSSHAIAADPFRADNLVAWCIVPFDAKQRGPEQRADMLQRLGFTRFAYDWRDKDIPTFDAEIDALQKRGIELTAFWFPISLEPEKDKSAATILDVLRRRKVRTQLWISLNVPDSLGAQEQKVEAASRAIRYVAEQAQSIGCSVGLYNHGGWSGEPENQLAIIQHVKLPNVGIVYNFHHGHAHMGRFDELLRKMQPHLLAININGMVSDGEQSGKKILPLGQGDHELAMLRAIRNSGYRGLIGILGHRAEVDAELALRENLEGLRKLLPGR